VRRPVVIQRGFCIMNVFIFSLDFVDNIIIKTFSLML
jgi:hypothetical protein